MPIYSSSSHPQPSASRPVGFPMAAFLLTALPASALGSFVVLNTEAREAPFLAEIRSHRLLLKVLQPLPV